MAQRRFYIGVDVSKDSLDVAFIDAQHKEIIDHMQVSNDDQGMDQMTGWLQSHASFDLAQTLFCMEATGLYCYSLLQFLQQNNGAVWVENAVQIKRSLGIVRGKNDKVDAKRIAQYALKHEDRVRLWQPRREVIEKLKHLAAMRDRLVETKKGLVVPVKEFRDCGNEPMAKILEKSMRKSLRAIDSDIESIEKQLREIIDHDDHLRKLFSLITSVAGVGMVTAINLIVHTNEFKILLDARKLACYCGIAPFEHTSGKSIRGKTRVHPMANKKLKTNLHMASLSGVKVDLELKKYYERKVAEGKSKLSVLNAVKNKIVARVIAVVKRGTPYEKKIILNSLAVS